MAHEGIPLVVIQRQHANLGIASIYLEGIASIYLEGIDGSEIISTVHGRPSPTMSASAGLQMSPSSNALGRLRRGPADPTPPPPGVMQGRDRGRR